MNLHHGNSKLQNKFQFGTSTRRFRADETFYVSQRLFQPIEFSFFLSLIVWIQAIKLRKNENSIGWKRFGSFISLHLAYRRKSVCFCSFYAAKHFFFSHKKTLKISAPNAFFENESNFFYIILDFFNKFLKT